MPERRPYAGRVAPSERRWLAVAAKHAGLADVPLPAVLGGSRRQKVVRARWAAWAELAAAERYSLIGIGRTTGFDHTSIRWGLLRMKAITEAERRRARAGLFRTGMRTWTVRRGGRWVIERHRAGRWFVYPRECGGPDDFFKHKFDRLWQARQAAEQFEGLS